MLQAKSDSQGLGSCLYVRIPHRRFLQHGVPSGRRGDTFGLDAEDIVDSQAEFARNGRSRRRGCLKWPCGLALGILCAEIFAGFADKPYLCMSSEAAASGFSPLKNISSDG